jgi:hypothetical protein
MAMNPSSNFSPLPGGQPVSSYFGMGGALSDQVKDETDELRKKRMAQLAGRPVSGSLGYGANVLGGPATLAFGGVGGFR